jgi:serine/threonine protein kinase
MLLAAGHRIGGYEILAPIGAGGMGEVYRARDTKLKRDVALKVLPEAFAGDRGRMARFQREAEVLASLNHPNIAHIYGVEDRALVMELVEGESPKGPMPFEEAWEIALEIADALEYAHDKGVIHRDLKPANIEVTPEGVVKLLDFGLAKAFSPEDTPSANPENSPTLTMGATNLGVILGTAAYMAPEQARGKRVDKRADIWSWGVVLYELVTGERTFQGEDAAETLAAVIHKQPDLKRVPVQVRRLVGECLQKDPKLRMRDIGDAKRLLEEPQQARLASPPWQGGAAVLAIISIALGFVAWKHYREEPPRVVKFTITPPSERVFPPDIPTMSVSPDGRRIAFETRGNRRELWVRELDNSAPRMLAVIEAGIPELPIWAPDSRRLAFFDGTKLKKIEISGGPTETIAETAASSPGSGSWNRDDVIIFGRFNWPLFRVAASGGTPEPLTQFDKTRGETTHWAPWFLPDGRHFLYVAESNDPEKNRLYVADLASKTRKQVLGFGTRAIYVNPGYLVYTRDRELMAQPFDAGKLESTGDPVPLAGAIDRARTGPEIGHFSASANGVLAYTSGGAVGDGQLTWFDRNGNKLGTVGAPGYLREFSLSPDSSAVVLVREDLQTLRSDLWVHDLTHDSEFRLTSSGFNLYPVFSADGRQVFFEGNRDGDYKVYRKAANGTGQEELVEATHMWPSDASRDYLFTNTFPDEKNGGDIWVLPFTGGRKPFAYVHTEFNETFPRISPDGRWLAYQSSESKRREIYVVSFPQPGGKWPVSNGGGRAPVWSRDGRELYYYSADNKIMAVEVKPGDQFQFGVPKALFTVRFSFDAGRFEVNKDGRFLLPALVEQDASAPITVVLNWPELLKKK